jgi:GAF domain-containing protein
MAKRQQGTGLATPDQNRGPHLLIMLPARRLFNSLSLRMLVPALATIGLVGAGLYFFVLQSVSDFADQEIEKALTAIASEIYDICDDHFTELMQAGKLDDRRLVTIKKAMTLGAIEEYATHNAIGCRVIDRYRANLLNHEMDPALLQYIVRHHAGGLSSQIRFKGNTYYFQHFDFKPWGWHIDLIKDTDTYAPLIARVKVVYTVTALILALGLFLILLFQERILRRPIRQIIDAIRVGQRPDYKGIFEFEFLSNDISRTMESLEKRSKWMEYLYRIALSNRGEDFFKRVAEALSEAMGVTTFILGFQPVQHRYPLIALCQPHASGTAPGDLQVRTTAPELSEGLPLRRVVSAGEPVIVRSGARTSFPDAPVLAEMNADSYAAVPILNRDGVAIGIMNLCGKPKAFDEWEMSLIQTVCQVVAAEIEYRAKEADKKKLEGKLQQSRKMEAIGLLAGGVAHDINNVLSGIVSYPDLLLLDLEQDSPLREPLLKIQRSGQKASRIVQDLLTLARSGVPQHPGAQSQPCHRGIHSFAGARKADHRPRGRGGPCRPGHGIARYRGIGDPADQNDHEPGFQCRRGPAHRRAHGDLHRQPLCREGDQWVRGHSRRRICAAGNPGQRAGDRQRRPRPHFRAVLHQESDGQKRDGPRHGGCLGHGSRSPGVHRRAEQGGLRQPVPYLFPGDAQRKIPFRQGDLGR